MSGITRAKAVDLFATDKPISREHEEVQGGDEKAPWTPNCVVARHNKSIDGLVQFGSCFKCFVQLKVEQNSSLIATVVKVALCSILTVAMCIYELGAWAVSGIKNIVCCCRKEAKKVEEEVSEAEIAAKKLAENEAKHETTGAGEKAKVAEAEVDVAELASELQKANDRVNELSKQLEATKALAASAEKGVAGAAQSSRVDAALRITNDGLKGLETRIGQLDAKMREIIASRSPIEVLSETFNPNTRQGLFALGGLINMAAEQEQRRSQYTETPFRLAGYPQSSSSCTSNDGPGSLGSTNGKEQQQPGA